MPFVCMSVCLSVRHSVCNTFLSPLYLLNPLNDFDKISFKCSSQWDCAQSTWPSYLDWRSRSQVKVKGLTPEFRAGSISPEPFRLFALYTTSKCSSQGDDMQILWVCYTDSRSLFKVKWFTFQFVSAPYLLNPLSNFHFTSPKCFL